MTDAPPPAEEPILDPGIAICDAHHHLWSKASQCYLLPDILDDIDCGHRIKDTVYVEWRSHYRTDGPPQLRPVGETMFAESIARESEGRPAQVCAAIVGFADLLLGDAVAPVLDAHVAASARFRGVRHVGMWDADPGVVGMAPVADKHVYLDKTFRAGFRRLRDHALTFDAWVFQTQLDDVTDLARSFPDQPIVMNHLGGVLGTGPYAGRGDELFSQWRAAISQLAQCPNVMMKLGGLGMARSGIDLPRGKAASQSAAEAWRPWIEHCIEVFGADRCMFESNFPVDKAKISYRDLWNAFKRVVAGLELSDREQILGGNARRFYRIPA